MKTAEKEQKLLFSVLFVHKDFILLSLVIAKPLTVVVCVNIRIKFNLPYPYSFFSVVCLFLRVLSCSPWQPSITILSGAARGGILTSHMVTHGSCSIFGEFFLILGSSTTTLAVLLPLPFALFLSGIFFLWHHGN